jgi:hypothetical protein
VWSIEYSYETYIILWVVCTEGSQSTVTKGTEFSGNRHRIPCTFVPNSAPIAHRYRITVHGTGKALQINPPINQGRMSPRSSPTSIGCQRHPRNTRPHSQLPSLHRKIMRCDAGCKAEFDYKEVIITHMKKTILRGPRDTHIGLWRIPMVPIDLSPTEPKRNSNQPSCNHAYQTQSIPDLIKFLHATAFSPTKTTWLQAIRKGFFQS